MSERLGCLKAILSLQAVHKAQRGRHLLTQHLLKQNIKTCVEWAIYCPRGLV